MKRFSWFIVISSLLALPLVLFGSRKKPKQTEEDKRYDISEYIADEGL